MNHFGQSLRYFIKTVELGSLTLAAEHFEISQSAISQQLSALEKELGSRLFIRKDKKGLTLSKNGELLYEKGKRILEDFDTLILEIKEKRNEKIETPIHYSILVSEGGDLLVPSLQYYWQTKLGNCEFREGGSEKKLLGRIDNNKLDCILSLKLPEGSSDHKNITAKEISRLPLKILLSNYSFFGSMENVEVADLSKLTFIRDEQTKALEEAIGSSIGIDWNALFPSQTQFMTRFDALEETKSNRGFLLANPFQSQLESDGLKEVSVVNNGIPLSLSLYCIWNKNNESIDAKLLSN